MHEIYFLARHAPFWGIPLVILGLEFAYLFWLKKRKRAAAIYFLLFVMGLSSTIFYFWAGGPERSVNIIKKIHRSYQN